MSDFHLFRYESLVFCGFHADVLSKISVGLDMCGCAGIVLQYCGSCSSASALIVLVIKQWWRSTRCKRICPNCPK